MLKNYKYKLLKFGLLNGLIILQNTVQAIYYLICLQEYFSMIQQKLLLSLVGTNSFIMKEKQSPLTKNKMLCLNIILIITRQNFRKRLLFYNILKVIQNKIMMLKRKSSFLREINNKQVKNYNIHQALFMLKNG